MALVTTMPLSISMPMSADRSSVWPVTARARKARAALGGEDVGSVAVAVDIGSAEVAIPREGAAGIIRGADDDTLGRHTRAADNGGGVQAVGADDRDAGRKAGLESLREEAHGILGQGRDQEGIAVTWAWWLLVFGGW